jgi:TolB-like protein/Tfp pilus assembly protein PilF
MSFTAGTSWLHRLRERGVIRVAASYAVIAWLLLQIADVTFEPLAVPRWAMVSLIVAAVLGFPVAVALAWFYEAGDGGVTRDTAAEGAARPMVHGLRRYADLLIIAVLLTAVAVLLVRQAGLGGDTGKPAIAVLPFKNLSAGPDGETLASGIAESVLHQLASLAQLDVISRTSSFALGQKGEEAREIGRQLGARYLLEGSVQSDRARMRVTTQLIDTETGADVWSMRFDRRPGDIFAVQDEIAVQVTQALELSLEPQAMERITGQGTTNLEAYLSFLQGRSLLANDRVVDMKDAIEHFERSIKMDPKFASAYVSLAEAELFVAEFEVTDDRQERFERAFARGQELVGKALSLDPELSDAYLERAYLETFGDKGKAEEDYRRGLALSPNSAKAYAGLAQVLYQTPARRDEALEMLERARKLDPLEPEYDVYKAIFLFYERGDMEGANDLLMEALREDPKYLPALQRLCELRAFGMGRQADAVLYCEQALAIDPLSTETRLHLLRMYLDLGELAAARQVAGEGGRDSLVPQVLLQKYSRDWVRAGEGAYDVLAQRTASPSVKGSMIDAIRMHARATGDTRRARIAIEDVAGVTWDAAGRPTWSGGRWGVTYAVRLADAMLLDGDRERGQRLLAEALASMNHDIRDLGLKDWYYGTRALAFALHGDRDAAIEVLQGEKRESKAPGDADQTPKLSQKEFKSLLENTNSWLVREPAFAPLRQDPRFQKLVEEDVEERQEHIAAERRELERMRAEELVPRRDEVERSGN